MDHGSAATEGRDMLQVGEPSECTFCRCLSPSYPANSSSLSRSLSVCLSLSLSLSPSASPVIIATWKVFALERRTKSCSCARMLLSLRACFPGLCSSLLCHCQDRNESQQPSCERSLASKSIVACIRHLRLNSCASRGLLSRCTDSLHSRTGCYGCAAACFLHA